MMVMMESSIVSAVCVCRLNCHVCEFESLCLKYYYSIIFSRKPFPNNIAITFLHLLFRKGKN
jgi:hypothetical protein